MAITTEPVPPTKPSTRQKITAYLAAREHRAGIWGLLAALNRSFGRVLLGFLLGFVCIIAVSVITHRPLFETTLEGIDHLGMAFLVAAIAVFGYEWQSHYKEFFQKLGEVKTTVLGLKDIVLGLRDIVLKEARLGIEAALNSLFPDDTHELNAQIRSSLQSIVTAVADTEKAADWNRDVYLALVAGMLTSLSDNSRISEELKKTTGLCTLTMPTSAELADFMLAAQMTSMDGTDEYHVISDFSSWAHGLTHFMTATEKAVGRGVKVRRIFYPFPYDASVEPTPAAKIIAEHWALAKRFPQTYFVAVTTSSDFVASHEGNFFHGDRVTKFRPLDRELRRIEFSQVQRQKGTGASFDDLWQARLMDSIANPTLDIELLHDELQRVWSSTRRVKST